MNFLWNRVQAIRQDKAFQHKAVSIIIPVAFQALLNTSLNMVDVVMIGQMGDTAISAVGLANKVFFVFSLLLFGVVSGSSVLTAQYWGKRDITNIRRVLGMSLLIGVLASFAFLIPSMLHPRGVMGIFTDDPDTIALGAGYLFIVVFSYPLTAITNAFVTLLRGVNEVKAPVAITMVAIGFHIVLNYILIFGAFGAPKLGVIGAAIALLIARIIECSALLTYVYLRKGPAAAGIREMLSFDREFLSKYRTTVTPVIANEFMWGLGVTVYSLVYGRMGNQAVAAITITQTVEQVLMVIFQGISAATAVILGNEMGANELKRAEVYAKNFIALQATFTFFVMILCYFIRWPVLSLFDVSEGVALDVSRCFYAFIFYMPFKMFNYINIVGILRSGGDTKFALFLDCSGVWFIGIPLVYLGGIVLGLPIYFVYAMVMAEEIYKFLLGVHRYRQKKWLKNIVGV